MGYEPPQAGELTIGGFDEARGIRTGSRALVILPHILAKSANALRSPEAKLAEAEGLTRAIALDVVHSEVVKLRNVQVSRLLGSGQIERLAGLVAAMEAEVVIIDGPVTPVQQRNLEKLLKAKVIDRTGLILEIFGERASTAEGTLQVELAHLQYQASRLVRSWTHLERQRGGFGFLGGPGESQIEIDRRLIGERIVRLKRELEQVRRTRGLHRRARERVPYPVVALVGYTNAGKSTLFNALTGAGVYAQDQLFATLDPTMRAIKLPSGRNVILSDTVGFISDLPTQLVEAFRATLEEVAAADLILHVRDIAHPDSAAQRADVLGVLEAMAEGEDATLDEAFPDRMLEVLNKADLLGGIDSVERRSPDAVAVSALTGEGLAALRAAIDARLSAQLVVLDVALPPEDGAAIAWLHAHGEVLERQDADDAVRLKVRLSPMDRARFESRGQK